MIRKTILATLMLAATTSPALAQGYGGQGYGAPGYGAQGNRDQGDWDWAGGRPGTRDYRLVGAGARMLIPELRGTQRGRAFVMRNFDRNRDGIVQVREAEMANRAFLGVAGSRRNRFDWGAYDRPMARVPAPVAAQAGNAPGRWDRRAMRDYGFRQTPRGATMTMAEEILFATDSAVLRPGAIDRLRPLADYLSENPGVRVAIDGHTDSRGSDAYNQALSLRRADAVRAAFDDMGVTRARFSVEGKGESQPVATNETAEGMRQNRRVEVTLLGQRADGFRD